MARAQSFTPFGLVIALVLGLALTAAPARGDEHGDEDGDAAQGALRCSELHFPVALTPGAAVDQEIVGFLCARGSLQHRTIQVLLHGATYDHTYWDFPFQPARYSYVESATAAGFATLALDRLGVGKSTRPDGLALTLHSNAFAVHQVVQALRSGRLTARHFGKIRGERVMLVGHSLGSFISTIEASTYHDVDAVILSGYSHSTGPGSTTVQNALAPADGNPKFGPALPPNYFTTADGTRAISFYHAVDADPRVIAVDEQTKATVTLGEVLDIFPSFVASQGVDVSTLVVVGDFDTIDCHDPSCSASRSLDTEAQNYAKPECVTVVDIPHSGHDLNLHLNAQSWYAVANQWASLFVGRDTRLPAVVRCY